MNLVMIDLEEIVWIDWRDEWCAWLPISQTDNLVLHTVSSHRLWLPLVCYQSLSYLSPVLRSLWRYFDDMGWHFLIIFSLRSWKFSNGDSVSESEVKMRRNLLIPKNYKPNIVVRYPAELCLIFCDFFPICVANFELQESLASKTMLGQLLGLVLPDRKRFSQTNASISLT